MATISSTIKLVDQMSSQLSTIESNINSMKSTLKSVSDEQDSIDKFSWSTFIANAESAGKKMEKIGKQMSVALTTPLVMLGKKLYGTATGYESAFAGVKKTTDATEAEYEALYQGLLEIAETNPTGFVEAAGIMEMAGQLGVAKEELIGFTEAYIGLQESTNINGEDGAADIARFLNVTEKSTANIERVGGVIVGLGNNFATTEQEILAMATRMGATADLAGFSSAEILAFSAALSSVGINAEAGGSAAGKLMKKMQLAAEVGGQAQEKIAGIHWTETDKTTGVSTEVWLKDLATNGLEFVNYLDTLKSAEKVDIASQLGMTVESLQQMADSWLLFDQFSEVMGISGEEFLKGWDESAAQSMLKFFQGLGNLDPESGNSVLAQLAEMDITEIRLSNLVAAMAGNADLFQAALAEAYKQYGMDTAENAMAVEVAKRYETQESQNAMLGNKLENSMADLGDNLVKALQPALDKVNELLNAFNGLSEEQQTNIINAFMIFAAAGPIVTAIGGTIDAIAKITKGIGKVKTALSGFLGNGGLTALLTNPVTWGIAAGAGILLLIEYLDSIPTKFETLAEGVTDIPITVDQGTVDETLSKIAEVQAALDGLKPGEVKQEYENTVSAVEMGYGTNDMYATALAYEAAKANAQINQTASDYAEKMNQVQQEMVEAASSGNTALADAKFAELEALRNTLNSELDSIKADYTAKLSSIFEGMASQYPEAASAIEKAAASYDVAVGASNILFNWDSDSFDNMDTEMEAWTNQAMSIVEKAFNAGLYDNMKEGFNEDMNFAAGLLGSGNELDFWNLDYFKSAIENGLVGFDLNNLLNTALENSTANLQTATQAVSDNPVLASWLSAMLNDPSITENMDVTQLQGALEGIFKTLDFKNALTNADNPYNLGQFVSEGLAQGIEGSADVPVGAGSSMGSATIDAIKAALGVASPSTKTIEAGLNVDEGLGLGISQNASIATGAASAMAGQVIAITISTLVPPAPGIGLMFSLGLAGGIRSGASAVISAAIAVANAGVNAAKGALGISSPSKVTYWQGEMIIAGYVNAIHDGSKDVERSVVKLMDNSETAWNNGVWDLISGFAETEAQALQDEFNNVKDGVKINESDIKKIRTLAEREVINHFTTAEVKVEMNNTNTINSDADIDSLISKLEDKVTERLEAVAEGVYP